MNEPTTPTSASLDPGDLYLIPQGEHVTELAGARWPVVSITRTQEIGDHTESVRVEVYADDKVCTTIGAVMAVAETVLGHLTGPVTPPVNIRELRVDVRDSSSDLAPFIEKHQKAAAASTCAEGC